MVWDDSKSTGDQLTAAEYNAMVADQILRLLKSLFDANTILKADSDNTPVALTLDEQRILGRITAGSITGLTAAQIRTLINVEDGATKYPDTGEQAFLDADHTKLNGIESGADVTDAVNVASSIHGVAAKATPVNADEIGLIDSAAANVLKKLTWANLKATLKTYFDTLYNMYSHPATRQCSTGDWAWGSISGKPSTYPPDAHTLASHSTKAHSELTGIGTSDHHVKTGNNEVTGLLQQGLIAARPAAGTIGKLYYATDEGILYRDTGAAWEEKARAEASTRLAQLSEKAHSSLTGIGSSDHHTLYSHPSAPPCRASTAAQTGHATAAQIAKLNAIESGATADQTKADIDGLAINAGQVDGIEGAEIFKKDGSVKATADFDMDNHGIGGISGLQKYGDDSFLPIYGGLSAPSRVNIHGKDYPTAGKAGRIYFPVTNAAKDGIEDAGYFEGCTDTPFLVLLHGLKTGVLTERVADAGIAIDGCTIKDGATRMAVTTKTAAHTALATDYLILCDCTAGAITISLPTAVGITGKEYIIKKIDAGANAVTIDPNGVETIDGAATKTAPNQWNYGRFVSNGSNWMTVGAG